MSGTTRTSESETTEPLSSGNGECGACGQSNPLHGQFCASCGHALLENCPSCAQTVLLSQLFCGGCGGDLAAAVEQRKMALERRITDAIAAAKDREFERAQTLLGLVTRESDYRFAEVVQAAKTAETKIATIAEAENETASDRIRQAEQAYQVGDLNRVVNLLAGVAPNLLPPESAGILTRSKRIIDEIQLTQQGLESAFEKRDWPAAGVLLDKMLGLQPEDESVAKLARKVGKKVFGKAEKLCQSHKFSAAAQLLECVPEIARDDSYDKRRTDIERVIWLGSQFDGEPFATPALGRLSRRWVECSGQAADSLKTLQRIAKRIKETQVHPPQLFPRFDEEVKSWIGGPIGTMAFPTSVQWADLAAIRKTPAQFNVAIGLALQGLGVTRYAGDFSPEKGGLFQRLSKKRSTRCWGMDLGASGIKAVLVELNEGDAPRVVDQVVLPFKTVLTRGVTGDRWEGVMRSGIEQFLDGRDLGDVPVWVSFPARELVSRFVDLPPVTDKQARKLFDSEIESQIPLPLEDIVYLDHIAAKPDETQAVLGRPSFVSAAKRQFVDRYLDFLASTGLTVAGLQATPIALANFGAFEFAKQMEVDGTADETADGSLPSIALIDCGAEATTLILLSKIACWFWSFESGGDDYTRVICRGTKRAHQDAERFKRDPARLEQPESEWSPIEQKMDEMQGRLKKTVSDTLQRHRQFDVRQTWCSGGGSLTHGWMRRVLCRNQ